MNGVYQILKYLNLTLSWGLYFKINAGRELRPCTDTDWIKHLIEGQLWAIVHMFAKFGEHEIEETRNSAEW